jgi:holin (3TMs family)
MPGLLSILSGPIKDLFGGAVSLINSIKGGSPEEKNAATLALTQLQTDFQSKLVEADLEVAKAQRDVIVAEAQGTSFLQRNWRPLCMLFFCVIIGTVVWTGGYINGRQLDPAFVMEILSIVKFGLGGYVVGRSAEKIVPGVVKMFVQK